MGISQTGTRQYRHPMIYPCLIRPLCGELGSDGLRTINCDGCFDRLACCSHNLETYVVTWPQSDAEILSIASQIFETIADALVVAGVPPVRAAFGPKPLVGGLLAGWSARASGPLTIREDAFLTTRLAYLTSSRFVEAQQRPRESGNSSRQPEVLDIATLKHDRDPEEVKKIRSELAQCIMAFWSSLSSESTPTAEKMINDVLNNGEAGRLWICHASGDEEDTDGIKIKGYLYLGRETRKTVTIRNVYTKDAFRGRGIASELVATACRWWLLEGEGDRRKEAVVLFVEPDNPAAMRTYLRCGFRVEEETWECRGFDGINMGAF